LVVIGFWIALQFFDELASVTGHDVRTLNGGVAYMAHIGGFLTGLALSFFWRRKEGVETEHMNYYRS
jgi:membrane associated rhomboid family serine protease